MGRVVDLLLHVPVQKGPFVLRLVRPPVFALYGISCFLHCTIFLPVLQAVRLPGCRLQRRRQLPALMIRFQGEFYPIGIVSIRIPGLSKMLQHIIRQNALVRTIDNPYDIG